jgi:hypothetical protein
MIAAYCKSVGIPYEPGMLKWGNEKDQQVALEAFEKWPGFHEDAIGSKELKARTHVSYFPTRLGVSKSIPFLDSPCQESTSIPIWFY